MHVEDRHGLDELRRAARSQKDGRMRVRLQALVLASKVAPPVPPHSMRHGGRFGVGAAHNQSGVEVCVVAPDKDDGRNSLEERDRLCAHGGPAA
jgi:hypothetical protein